MNLPVAARLDPLRAWIFGVVLAPLLEYASLRLPYGLALAAAVLVLYAFTVGPRPFAASGVLFGSLPVLAWGVLDGLLKCTAFNSDHGSCSADASAQIAILVAAYLAALLLTAVAIAGRGR